MRGATRATIGALLLSTILFAGTAQAAIIVDQNQPSVPDFIADFTQPDLAQSFKQSADNIAGAGIFLRPGIGSTDTVTISLWDALPNAGGALLTSASGSGTQGTWFDVFWTPVAITAGATYYLVFTGNMTLGISGDIGNPYPDGQVYANAGFQPFATFDYAFRTYADDAAAVPEPATLALFGLGLAGLGFARRRRAV